jgi:myo-inositol-1(or 4)-monophosphatase
LSHASRDTGSLALIEDCATEWAAECGRLASEYFRSGMAVEYKGPGRRDPVTEADRRVEDFLRATISDRFPEHRVLGEERPDVGPVDADFIWVLDPIDGTANFASGLPVFAVSIGVLQHGVPVVGAVYTSVGLHLRPGVIHARRGGGCVANGERLVAFGEPTLHPSRPAALPAAYWRRFRFGRGLRWQPIEARTTGSIAWELTMIAAGALQFGAYPRPHIWDLAAGAVLIREAGGLVLYWERARSSWLPLERFDAPLRNARGAPGALRDWTRPVLLGGSLVTTFVAQHLRPRDGLRARLWPLLWRLFAG